MKKCGFCASKCGSYRYMAAPNATSTGSHTVQPFCYGFRQDREASVESAALTGDLGLNGWETAYGVIPWLQMCKQQGLIQTTGRARHPRARGRRSRSLRDTAPVRVEFSAALLHKMAYPRGRAGRRAGRRGLLRGGTAL